MDINCKNLKILFQLWSLFCVVGSCKLKTEWKRWAWSHHYHPEFNTKMWTITFSTEGNIRLQMRELFSTEPITEWVCSSVITDGSSTYIYSQEEIVNGINKARAHCFHIIDVQSSLLFRRSPVNVGQTDCTQHDDTDLPFVILHQRPIVKCSEASIVVGEWAFRHERTYKMDHEQAEYMCFNWGGGHLAWFNDNEEFQSVVNSLRQFAFSAGSTWFGTLNYHIGYKKRRNKFLTTDGDTSPPYFNWRFGQPNKDNSCVMTRADKDFNWDTVQCTQKEASLCKTRCFQTEYFNLPVNKCPFRSLVGQRHHVYYNEGTGSNNCKGTDSSIAIFTESDITFNTCTDSYSYDLPLQNTMTCIGTISENDSDKGNILILSERFEKTDVFHCARYKEEGDLYISIDVTNYKQAECRPGHTYKSAGEDTDNEGKYILFTVDLVDNEPTTTTSIPETTTSITTVISSSSTSLSMVTNSSEPSQLTLNIISSTIYYNSSVEVSSLSYTSTVSPVTEASSTGSISPLGIGMIVLAIILVGIVLFALLLYNYLSKNRYRTDGIKMKRRAPDESESPPQDDGYILGAHHWGGTVNSGYAPSYLSYKA